MSLSFKALAAQSFTLYYSTPTRVICNRHSFAHKCLGSCKRLTRFNPDGINSLENEISKEYKSAIEENEATHKLVPPGDHRHNITKKYIQTYKNHFFAVLTGLHKSFPIRLWCQFLLQAEIQLNLQRQYAITPKISACVLFHIPHNFMHKPLSLLGFPVLTDENPYKRERLSDDVIDAWTLGTPM